MMKVLVYGQPGIGKSTLALSMPAPLMIDCDRGVHRVEPIHLSDTVEVDRWEDVDEVLKEDLSAYKTLIFDTGGKLIDYMSEYIMRNNPKLNAGSGQLSLQGYGVRKAMFNALLSRIGVLGKHVVFVAHEREERDGDIRFVRPEIGGSSGNDLIKELDIVGYMEAIGTKRVIRFNPQEKFYAKNALQLPDPMDVPNTDKGNTFLQGLVAKYDEQLVGKKAKAELYEELLDVIQSNLEGVVCGKSANEFIEWQKNLEHIWDSRYQAGKGLKARAEELNLAFDRDNGKYVEVKERAKKEAQ